MQANVPFKPTIYVITYHRFNHEEKGRLPLDHRFLKTDHRYVFYLIDKATPPPLRKKEVLFEHEIDLPLHHAGAKYFAEWSFLLAEAKHSFCTYPFFMVSSRFYEKNRWLLQDLNQNWELLFSQFKTYGWGYLPSYDRPFHWLDLKKNIDNLSQGKKNRFFPLTLDAFSLIQRLYQIDVPKITGGCLIFFVITLGSVRGKICLITCSFIPRLFKPYSARNLSLQPLLKNMCGPQAAFVMKSPLPFF